MFLISLSVFALAAWTVMAFVRLPVFRRLERLDQGRPAKDWPAVVAIIPARNEAETIAAVTAAHFACDYRGPFSVIIVDDHSTDGTAEIAWRAAVALSEEPSRQKACLERQEYVTRFTTGRSLAIKAAPSLPAGWTGKLWAVNAGLEHAESAAADARYVLLTDADIVLAPDTLTRLVVFAERNSLSLASLMSRLDARGFWGGLLIPAFVFFFQKLYPFHRVNERGDKVAAAAGGCMLVRRSALTEIGGVAQIRDRLIDDCALAGLMKKAGKPIWIGLAADEAVSLRDNRSLSSIWTMVERTAFTQLGHSWVILAGAIVGMALLYFVAPLMVVLLPWHQNAAAAAIAAFAWVLMAAAYAPTMRLYGQPAWKALFLPAAALLYTAMTISSARRHAVGMGGAWKGRTYPA